MRPSLVWGLSSALLLAGCVEPRQDPLTAQGFPDAEAAAPGDDAGTAADSAPGDAAASPDASPDAAAPPSDGPAAADLLPADTGMDAPPLVPDVPSDGPAKRAVGQRCQLGADCASARCADGVCCATACAGPCNSCAAADTGKSDGTCAPVLAGQDPRNDCAASGQTCGQDGACDGAGKCRVADSGLSCGAESCGAGRYTAEPRCDGKGACITPAAVSCGNYPCQGNRCNMSCSAAAPCIDGFYCNGGTCLVKKAIAIGCGLNEECASGACADGICCDRACGSKCSSCLAASTGAAQGTCAPVKAGADPDNECAVSSTTCREDGTCDGQGGCRLVVSGTACRGEQCVDGGNGSTYFPGAQCSGAGSCVDLAASSACPGGFTCAGNRCKSSCNNDADCSGNFYCKTATHTCEPKKGLGIACGGGSECGTGICGGRCCTQACTCTTQSGANRLANAGFDTSINSWTVVPKDSNYASHTFGFDGTSCSNYSGSAMLTPSASHPDSSNAAIYQCVTTTVGKTYNFGGLVSASMVSGDWNGWCTLAFYKTEAECKAGVAFTELAKKQLNYYPKVVQTFVWYDFDDSLAAPNDGNYARLDCDTVDDSAMNPNIYLDNLFVSEAPAKF